jgi:uncharacterized protein (DUF58 family)
VTFYDVREYQPGDPLRHIHWHAGARRPERLFTKEYEQERVADIGLILDARRRSNPSPAGISLFEHSAKAVSAMASAFIQDGHRVGLLTYGDSIQWTFPGYGKLQHEKIQLALARAREGDSQVFAELDHLPTRLLPSGSQLVFVSPLTPDDAPYLGRLRARGYDLFVVSPDPLGYESWQLHLEDRQPDRAVAIARRLALAERTLLVRDLEQAGVLVLDWDVRMPLRGLFEASRGKMRAWSRHRGRRW